MDYLKSENNPEKGFKRENAYQIKDKNYKHRDCFYCEKSGHKVSDCKTVSDIEERRLILSKKKLCFSCTRTKHRTSECLSNRSCVKCKGKHHSSICDNTTNTLLTTSSCSVTYHVVIIEIEGFSAVPLYIPEQDPLSTLINHTNKKPIRTKTNKIETLMSTNTRKIKIYSVKIQEINCEFCFETELNHLEKEVLRRTTN